MAEIIFSRRFFGLILLSLAVVISVVFAASFGAANISMADVLTAFSQRLTGMGELNAIKERIIIDLRLPRVILAFIAGAGLALSGSVLQTVTRNPLADPYLFGISSGASFGAVVVLTLFSSASAVTLPIGAFIGSTTAVLLVLAMAGKNCANQIEHMLLSGVAVSFMFSAGTSLMLYLAEPQAAASVLFWTLGSFARAQWHTLALPLVIVSACLVLFVGFKRQIDAVLAGDESAQTLGIPVAKLRLFMLVLSSLITGVLVANCGGIGFVGLMIPHLVRMTLTAASIGSLWITALAGGLFLVWVDVIARTAMTDQELPVGVITSAIGSIFFLIILLRRRQGR
jgi:iron complex transport system permease protein